jgi:hypothetical protein
MTGLALAAVFVSSAFAAALASAAEVLLVAENGGSAVGTSFTSKTEPGSTLVFQTTKAGSKLTCTEGTGRGTVTGPKTAETTGIATGCESSVSGKKCESGSTSGEIVSTGIGKLGVISSSKGEYGVLLTPSPAIKIECGAAFKIEVVGSSIAAITRLNGGAVTLNTPYLTYTLSAKQVKGVQSILSFEGGGNELLEASENGSAFEMLGTESEGLVTYSKKVELTS